MSAAPLLKFDSYGREVAVVPEFGVYPNGRLAIGFIDLHEGHYGTLTVNVPSHRLHDGEIFVKDWSENADLSEACVQAGWIELTGAFAVTGFSLAKVARLAGPLARHAERVGVTA